MAEPVHVGMVTIPGSLTGHVGNDYTITVFSADVDTVQVVARITDTSSTDTVIRIEDFLQVQGLIDVTILAGQTSVIVPWVQSFTSGTKLIQTVTSAPAFEAMNLSGEVTVDSAAGAAPPGVDLTTLALVQQDMGIGVADIDADRDAFLSVLVTQISKRMLSWMNRPGFGSTAWIHKLDSGGDISVYTLEFPIISIASLTVLGSALVEGTDFEVLEQDKPGGRIVRISGDTDLRWARGQRVVAVTYQAGYLAIPPDLEQAATAQVVQDFNQSGASGKSWRGLLDRGVDPVSAVTYDLNYWTRVTQAVMSPYKRWAS